MIWIAPSEKAAATADLEKRLWDAADQFRANSGLKSQDPFGRIYEYFLGEFAMSEGQGGGEFYTPGSIVRLLTEVIEAYHGRILDPACGSGGMFVSSARFVSEHKASPPSTRPAGHPSPTGRRDGDERLAAQYSGAPSRELSIHGVEKTDETGRLCRLNPTVHRPDRDIDGFTNEHIADDESNTFVYLGSRERLHRGGLSTRLLRE